MNEATWRRLLQWEALHQECGRPALVRFLGRPDDLRCAVPAGPVWRQCSGSGCVCCFRKEQDFNLAARQLAAKAVFAG